MTEHKVLYENENLLRLARKRVKDRKRFVRYIWIYFLSSSFLFWAVNAFYDDIVQGIFFGIWISLSVLMADYVFKYFRPHLPISKKDPIEAEYEKLKRMDYDEIARAFSKM